MTNSEGPKSGGRSPADWYRQEWAAKTGRPASEVYVPEALREPEPEMTLEELRRALGLE